MQKLLVLMSTKKDTTTTLSTLSVVSSYVKEMISKNHYAKIHSVFPNGFNLNFAGELVYVSDHQVGMLSARGLSIDKQVFDLLLPHLKVGVHVRIRKEQLVFYTRPYIFTITCTEKKVKNLQVVPVTENELEAMAFKSRLEKMNLLEKSGFWGNDRLNAVLEEIGQLKELELDQVDRLIGAGVGLTPTGDDFLQGFILMEQTLNHLPHIQSIVQQRLKKRTTTDVSLSYYDALFAGFSNEPLVILFQAVKDQDEKSLIQAISYIQQYGQTSGYDLLIGILTYLQII